MAGRIYTQSPQDSAVVRTAKQAADLMSGRKQVPTRATSRGIQFKTR